MVLPSRRVRRDLGLITRSTFAGRGMNLLVLVLVLALALTPRPTMAQEEAPNRLQKGCLYNKLSSHNQLRVCNSEDYLEDGIDPVAKGVCRAPEFDYLEVRIKCQVSVNGVFEYGLNTRTLTGSVATIL